MDLSIIGTGYVGLVSGTCFSELGNTVTCIDNNPEKIKLLQSGKVPFYEPELQEKINRNTQNGRLKFSENLEDAIESSELIFVAVGTPPKKNGEADLTSVFSVINQIILKLKTTKPAKKGIIIKSTVPVGTCKKIESQLMKNGLSEYTFVASNPEFLREGSAIYDFFHPDRIVIGANNDWLSQKLKDLYSALYRTENPVIITNLQTSELSKYAANTFLATKISFINEMATLCEILGANVKDIAKIMGKDSRIGKYFLHPGPGYGGSCFPKDTKAFINIANEVGYELEIVKAAETVNQNQKNKSVKKLLSFFPEGIQKKKIAILGLSYKQNTDDVRESAAITVIQQLLDEKAIVSVYDPEATENTKKIFGEKIIYNKDIYETANEAEALLVLTEWNVFRETNLQKIKECMKRALILDLRSIYSPEKLKELGFEFYSIGLH